MQRIVWAAIGLLAAIAQTGAFQAALRFEDYPVAASNAFHGKPALPQLKTPGQKMFRTMIREGAAKGPVFAGHYSIAQWGCGAGCMQMALIDARTGAVYDGPFGVLPKGTLALGPDMNPEDMGPFFHLDSSLLWARGCPNEKDCGTYYYRWTGEKFERLRRIPLAAQGFR